ncbi:MAG: AMP-binding protein [Acidimicrobiales bacterium]
MDGPAVFNLADLFEAVADHRGDDLAVVSSTARASYRQLDRLASCWATALAAAGVDTGDRVALMLRNHLDHVAALLGSFKLRAVPLNVNLHYTAEELRHLLADADPAVVVCEDELEPTVRSAVEQAAWGPHRPAAVRALGAFAAEAAAVAPAERRHDRDGGDGYLLYTGGTTGLPKGVSGARRTCSSPPWAATTRWMAPWAGPPMRWPPCATPHPGAGGLPADARHRAMGDARRPALGRHGGAVHRGCVRRRRPARAGRTGSGPAQLVVVGDAFAVPLADAAPGPTTGASMSWWWWPAAAPRWPPRPPGGCSTTCPGRWWWTGTAPRRPAATPATSTCPGPRALIRTFRPDPDTGLIGFDGVVLERQRRAGPVGRCGHIPLGYRNDPTRTAVTFPVIAGRLGAHR